MRAKSPCVYILASKPNGVLYIGVTSDLEGRMAEHDQGLIESMNPEWCNLFDPTTGEIAAGPADAAREKR
jgi:putative endonuclease